MLWPDLTDEQLISEFPYKAYQVRQQLRDEAVRLQEEIGIQHARVNDLEETVATMEKRLERLSNIIVLCLAREKLSDIERKAQLISALGSL